MQLAWFFDPVHATGPRSYRSVKLTQELVSRNSTAEIVYRQSITDPLPAAFTEVLLAGRTVRPEGATWGMENTLDGWTFPQPAKLAFVSYDTADAYAGRSCLSCNWMKDDTVPLFERRWPTPQDWSGFEFSAWVGLPYDPPLTGRVSTWLEDVTGTVRIGPAVSLQKAKWVRVADVCSLGGSTGKVQQPHLGVPFYPYAIVRAGLVFQGTFTGGSYNFNVLLDSVNVSAPVVADAEIVSPPWPGILWDGPANGLPPGVPPAIWDSFVWADYQKPADTDRGWG